MADWMEIAVPVAPEHAEDVAAVIADEVPAAAQGTELRDDCIVFWVTIAQHERAVSETRETVAALAERGLPLDPSQVIARPAVPESEWRDAWKRYFHVTRLTPRIVVVPSWERYQPVAGDVVIDLDPGQAFGTGAHASTRLCLAAIDARAGEPTAVDRFLDVGTGSGILAIAAAKMWPGATGIAVDVDPLAVDAARENLTANGVGERVATSETPLSEIDGRFDLVVANIRAHILVDLRPELSARVAPGGLLVLSGLLTGQVDDVAAAFAVDGLELAGIDRSTDDPEWSAARLRRAA